MKSVRERFEEIWPVPDVILWSQEIGRYAPKPDEVLQYERQNELRAENAGLKTGYQAYERVNAELKAEVGALRTALGPLLTHWDDVKPGESMNVDRARSAMRWGECP